MRSRGHDRWAGWLLLCTLAAACGEGQGDEDLPPLGIPQGCNPLAADWDCLLPYPSDVLLVEDAGLPSGRRISLSRRAAVVNTNDVLADPTSVHPADGFSTAGPILVLFPGGVDDADLVFHTGDLSVSLTPRSPTVLLRADTGEPVLHFAELDPLAEDDARRVMFIRPLVPLAHGTRYVVGIHGLRDRDGAPVLAPEGFRRIRDGQAASHPVLRPLAARYEQDVFAVLEAFGVGCEGLQLAWDFTTGTEEHVTGDMLAVRRQVIDLFEQQPPQITIDEVTDEVDEHIFRRIDGTIRVPLFMDSPAPGARLHRDAAGRVVANGDTEVAFTVLIPRSVAAAAPDDPPARLLQYGHGFFGFHAKDSEIARISKMFDQAGFVFVGMDWWGMCVHDVGDIVEAIANRPSEMMVFTDRVHQGMANLIAMTFAARGPLLEEDALQVGPDPLYDPDHIYFYGLSQGHILGGSYLALSPHVERAVLGVGGGPFTLMMFRARPFIEFLAFIQMYIPDPLDQQKFTTLAQTTFDRIDPATYAPRVLGDTYPDGPAARKVLIQAGIGDTQVPNLATHFHARALGVRHLQPAPRPIAGLEPADAPHQGSALVEFDFGIDPLPGIEARPPDEGNEVHNTVRELDAACSQIDLFLRPDGRIEHTCEGLCDPE